MNCWPVVGLASCWGASLDDKRTLTVLLYGVFSHGWSGLEMICRSASGLDTVHGSLIRVMQSMAGHETYFASQQEYTWYSPVECSK